MDVEPQLLPRRRPSNVGQDTQTTSPLHKRQSMHFKSSPSPLAWKETYRKKCIQRLRTGREKLIDRFRNIRMRTDGEDDEGMDVERSPGENVNLRDLMREEWNLLMKGRAPGGGDDSDDFDEGDVLKMMEEVEAELKSEKLLILEEYEKLQKLEEAELCAAVDDYLSTTEEDVLCPVCLRDNLQKPVHNVVGCGQCGMCLHLDCDTVSLRELKARLQRAVEAHATRPPKVDAQGRAGQPCGAPPVFSVVTEPTMHCQNLAMLCPNCDHYEIIV